MRRTLRVMLSAPERDYLVRVLRGEQAEWIRVATCRVSDPLSLKRRTPEDHSEYVLESMNRQIKNLYAGSKVTENMFVVFELEGGGRVSIPPDQIARMWNEEQDRRAAPQVAASALSPTIEEMSGLLDPSQIPTMDELRGPQVAAPAPEPDFPEIVASAIDEYMRQGTPVVAPNATTHVPPVAEHPDPDWPKLNRERGELITKSLDYALSGDERARLQYLTGYADARIATARRGAEHPDTQRMDWLEDPANQVWEVCVSANPKDPDKTVHVDWKDFGSAASGKTWRAAIDAARAGEKP